MLRAYTATQECKTEQENTHSAPSWHAKRYKDTLIQRNHVMLNTTPKIELPRSPNTVPARKSASCKTNEPKISQLLRLSAYQTDPRQGCRCGEVRSLLFAPFGSFVLRLALKNACPARLPPKMELQALKTQEFCKTS